MMPAVPRLVARQSSTSAQPTADATVTGCPEIRPPLILVVAAMVDEQSHILPANKSLFAAAVAENTMVAAFALGFGCAWKTGDASNHPAIKSAFKLAPADAIVGFLDLGSNASPPAPP